MAKRLARGDPIFGKVGRAGRNGEQGEKKDAGRDADG